MIVDLHTRVWDKLDDLGDQVAQQARRQRRDPWDAASASFDTHEQAMAPTSFAVVHGFEAGLLDSHLPAEHVATVVHRSPQTLLGFVGIDPSLPGALEKVEDARQRGLCGVSVCPTAAGFHPVDTRAMALYERCEKQGLPVYVEAGWKLARQARMEYGQPFLLDEVARSFPNLRLIVGGFGDPWPLQTVALLAKHPGVFTDTSGLVLRPWQLYNALVSAYQAEVMSQVLFASGFPLCEPEKAIVTLYRVNAFSQGTPLPSIPREQLRGVVERDTLGLLNLKAPDEADDADLKSSSAFEQIVMSEGAAPGDAT